MSSANCLILRVQLIGVPSRSIPVFPLADASCLLCISDIFTVSCLGRKCASQGFILNWIDCQAALKSYNKKESRPHSSLWLFMFMHDFFPCFQIKFLLVLSSYPNFPSSHTKPFELLSTSGKVTMTQTLSGDTDGLTHSSTFFINQAELIEIS